jgi:hypothetical protein
MQPEVLGCTSACTAHGLHAATAVALHEVETAVGHARLQSNPGLNQNRETVNSDWHNNSLRAVKTTSTNNREIAFLTSKVTQREPSMRFNQNRETIKSNRRNNSARAVRAVSTKIGILEFFQVK